MVFREPRVSEHVFNCFQISSLGVWPESMRMGLRCRKLAHAVLAFGLSLPAFASVARPRNGAVLVEAKVQSGLNRSRND